MNAKTLTRDAILKAGAAIRTETVDVPEWGGPVKVRELTGRDRDSFELAIVEQKGKDVTFNRDNVRAKLIVRAVVDDDGERVFTDADADAVGSLGAKALDRVYSVAARLSGITDDDLAELEGN